MDKWSSMPAFGWIIVSLLLGYACGLIHAFFLHWFHGKIFCPRCLYYLNWRETILRDVVPDWLAKPRTSDPWDRGKQKPASNLPA